MQRAICADPDLGPAAKSIGLVLVLVSDSLAGVARSTPDAPYLTAATYEALARHSGRSRAHVARALADLETAGWIDRKRTLVGSVITWSASAIRKQSAMRKSTERACVEALGTRSGKSKAKELAFQRAQTPAAAFSQTESPREHSVEPAPSSGVRVVPIVCAEQLAAVASVLDAYGHAFAERYRVGYVGPEPTVQVAELVLRGARELADRTGVDRRVALTSLATAYVECERGRSTSEIEDRQYPISWWPQRMAQALTGARRALEIRSRRLAREAAERAGIAPPLPRDTRDTSGRAAAIVAALSGGRAA